MAGPPVFRPGQLHTQRPSSSVGLDIQPADGFAVQVDIAGDRGRVRNTVRKAIQLHG